MGRKASIPAFHVARTVCRRAERAVVRLASTGGESVEESSLRYLNRLSALLFVIARHENARRGRADVGKKLVLVEIFSIFQGVCQLMPLHQKLLLGEEGLCIVRLGWVLNPWLKK